MRTTATGPRLASLAVCAALAVPAAAQAPPAPAEPQTPSAGAVFPAFDAQALDGVVRHVAFPKGGATILLFFLSSCPTCHKMIPEWNRMYEKRAKGLNIVGVILDREPPGFFDAYPVAFPVVRSPGNEFMRRNRVNRVPLTLRVVEGGRIEEVGLGQLDPIRLGEIFRP